MNYSIQIKGSASKDLERLSPGRRRQIASLIDNLRENPLSGNPLRGNLRGLRRLRVGRYRIIYQLLRDENIVLIVRIADRREAYRRM